MNLPLKKFNVLYGQNGSGKSSVAYAPYVMRNFFVNPNQSLNSLFNFGFINLGGIDNIFFDHNYNNLIEIKIKVDLETTYPFYNLAGKYLNLKDKTFQYNIVLDKYLKALNQISYKIADVEGKLNIDFPFSLNEKVKSRIGEEEYLWNGLTFESLVNTDAAKYVPEVLNSAFENIKTLEIISVKRGFYNPIFSTEQATDESLFAMQIRNEGTSFEGKIDYYFKQLFDKTFRFVAIPGSTSFYLRTQNGKGFTTDLVNEGFGVNQTVYMLIKLLKKNTSLAFIEEPEIHLHPSAQAKLVDVFTEIIQKENKQIFITTHSENIVSSVLAKIAAGELDRNDVQFFLAKLEDGETKVIPQEVNEKGQIESGLMNFMETELTNLKSILGI
jgi:predicted ATP-dependent endonuclease of OLD family